ncbi:serine/threonine protein kinase (plasmid) [Pseudonocardia sp. EC080610-09]|uniref:SDR family NAD(P)-dependent oxidoreductase n=1 Tax=unclassified Pseudonocardia TaxID=2619320 RepID=UPI0007064652|nr:SDR family NAD(P)-dependent oxidoreductase [Pseudonocardia sp. EC080610-09]ALL79759.1 serine/threonine protein kinase [Pseudonocardia sp. EC080610-09]ALL85194.1 serine/threonine protein kinase [Pseudonocardia sp. EC080619-01]
MDFAGRVAVVTGAGGGLGRSHALLLASRGARVVVNDLGGAVAGEGADATAADLVVAEIEKAGGEAVANHDSVADPVGARQIVQTALDHFGKIDILVNNAGILRDRTFKKQPLEDFTTVLGVHLLGTVYCTHAAWPHMNEAKYGRIVVTTSIAGTNGNLGQSAYGTAKLGMVGLMNSLAIEGARNNVLINAISPGAATRMTAGLNPPALDRYLTAELVSPGVAYLVSEECSTSGQIVQTMAGGYSRVHLFETDGVQFDPARPLTPEMIADRYEEIADLSTATPTQPGIEGRTEQRLRAIGRWED